MMLEGAFIADHDMTVWKAPLRVVRNYTLRFRIVMALPPITAAAVSLSLSKTVDTAAELSLTLNHSFSPSSRGGKKG